MFILFEKEDEQYTDFAAVEAQHQYVIPEEFPEGPYGSSINSKLGKSTPWGKDQKTHKALSYDYEKPYEETERQYPDAAPTLDNPDPHELKPI
ncbi:hypothetical protein [Bacillus panaciterrae]|uniref:hypothetical protein n=1 Tax=Ectobacillus panaciterrae TaxID=363872 RepID=UPI00048B656C